MSDLIARAKQLSSMKARHRMASGWLEPRAAGDRRWTARSSLGIVAELRPRWRRRFPVDVRNLSTHGCGIADPGRLVVGDYAWVILPTLESWYARIAWSARGMAGLDFVEPLHNAVTDMIIDRAADARPKRPLVSSTFMAR